MLAAMFDIADALGALQQAGSIKVSAVSGSWDWTLVQMSCAWSNTMHGVLELADLTLAHVTQLSEASASALLAKVRSPEVLDLAAWARDVGCCLMCMHSVLLARGL
jgi:hypothetical protein